jgi:hypothetical protein
MLYAATLVLATLSAPAAVSPEAAVAGSWLEVLDTQKWVQSWEGTGKLFRSKLTQDQWAKIAQAVREPLGAVQSRTIIGATKSQSLPGAPDGEYQVLQYRTVFANKASSVETVVLVREGDQWKIVGYFIR